MRTPTVYILASSRNGTLYVGVTSNLPGRMTAHKGAATEGFTRHYLVTRLVWYEVHSDMMSAIRREKQLKKWDREWKLRLIERFNPSWTDLSECWEPV